MITYHPNLRFPPLAWFAIVQPSCCQVRVEHGPDVECHPRFFVEGVWDGSFNESLSDSSNVFGSGAVAEPGKAIVFVAPSATTDAIYYRETPERITIANSLPLLLAVLHDRLDPAVPAYADINDSIKAGIDRHRAEIPTRAGSVRRLLHYNLRIDRSGCRLLPKSVPPRFGSFSDYRDYLRSAMRKIFDNARTEQRRQKMKAYSTQSTGYDSTAINSLCRDMSIDRVFTCPESKEPDQFYMGTHRSTPRDDGSVICAQLGLPCTKIERRHFLANPRYEELYYAGLHKVQDFNLHGILAHVDSPTLLLTGILGEIWYTRPAIGPARLSMVNDQLQRWDLSGHGLSELRLHHRILHVPVPFIGARNRDDILGITESDEMRPWRLGGRYDRPIPRRIAEETGIPREAFGQHKLATVIDLPTPSVPVDASLRKEYFIFLRRHRRLGRTGRYLLPLIHRINNYLNWRNPARVFGDHRRHPLAYYAGRAYELGLGRPLRFPPLWRDLDDGFYCFAVNRVADTIYEPALSETRPDNKITIRSSG